jgi:hypothetical protein
MSCQNRKKYLLPHVMKKELKKGKYQAIIFLFDKSILIEYNING